MLKNIMFFIPSFEYGGAERVTSYLTSYFAEQGYNVSVGTCEKKVDREYDVHPDVQRFYFSRNIEVINAVKKYAPHLIVIMFAPMAITVVPAIKKLRVPYIISERNDPQNFVGKWITKKLYQHYMKRATGLVFQTHEAKDYYDGKVKGRQTIIYNPLRLGNFPEPYNGVREKRIVNVGRLHYQKNQKLLIEAFSRICKKHPEYILEIYGEGELRNELQDLIVKYKLDDRVVLKGNKKDVLQYEQKAALFVLSSDFEGMPNALIEAMALGLPVISTDCPCGGPRELIKDGINGSLVPVGDAHALAQRMDELLSDIKKLEQYSAQTLKIREILEENIILHEWEQFCIEIANEYEVSL